MRTPSRIGVPNLAPLLFYAAIAIAPAFTLRVDFNDGTNQTQSGWQSLGPGDSELGDSWSKNLGGGLAIDADAAGAVTLDSRDRSGANGGGSENGMWRDFLFANGSFSTLPGSGLSVTITGLGASTVYPITIWAFDDSSSPQPAGVNRAADWSGGGGGGRLDFGNAVPSSLADSKLSFDATTSASGSLTLTGIVSASNPSSSHNVFINGLEIGDPSSPPTAPTDIALSNTVLATTAPIGATVGTLTTTDPTPGDTFTYTLVGGAGSADNADFAIDGDRLETDRDLSANPGGTMLQVRIRTTDADSDFYEEAFVIELVNDSDGDGLDDAWELLYFPSLTTATGAGNNDADGFTNLQEQGAGTDPTLADTDGDGLDDDDEVDTHGSDPLVLDSDGDGIDDGDEVSAANGYVTNPALADSDGDGFNDGLELAENTDPTDSADFPNTLLPLRINEILARNNTDITDGNGRREDWIEIYNPNTVLVNLDGYYLTDDEFLLTQWNFPNVTIPAGGYLLVFASGNDNVDGGGNPHTNFELSSGGEFLAIVRPDGTSIDDSFAPAYPEQFTDVSYGPLPTGGAAVFYGDPTPGAVNNSTPYPGVVKDTNFNIDRGFYDAPFQVAITSATPTATIRYTTDGSWPSISNGTVYSGPVDVTTTTTLRAIAYQSGWLSTNVDTHTYIFVDDVAQQPSDPPGWPSDWGSHDGFDPIPSDYEMDPRVVNNANGLNAYTIQQALLDIPTVSIAMDPDDFISDASGIQANPQSRVEKICSMEYILPDGSSGFQENCKIETHGNASRRPARMHKHSFRVTFTADVGIPKLNYPLFSQSDVETFNKLVLRACFTDGWALVTWGGSNRYRPNDSMYLRDVWMKDSMRAMGHASGNGDFVHLYVNGLYWGVHDLTERLEDDWYADHIGGETEDWEVNADMGSPGALWDSMMSTLNGDITSNAVYDQAKTQLDIDNYIDYIFLHFYADAEDWPTKNGYAAANATSGDGKYRFQVWDQEISLDNFDWDRNYTRSTGSMEPFSRLRLNSEFLMDFADRVALHMFNGGAMSEQASIDRFLALCAELDKAIMAESARWGDVQDTVYYATMPGSSTNPFADFYPPTINSPIYFTREQHWIRERDHVVNTHIPIIHDASDPDGIINELRANNLYPSIDPPVFAQHGGPVPNNFNLGITASAGDIYFTTDGSDPRLVGGAVNPAATMLAGGSIIDGFVDFEETGWRFLDTGAAQSDSGVVVGHGSYGTGDWKHPDFDDASWGTGQALLGYGSIGSGGDAVPVNTTVGFGPSGTNKYRTTYFRKPFTVTGAPAYTELDVNIIRDDGAIVYLNGKEVGRTNLSAGNRTFSDFASSASPEHQIVSLPTLALQPGDLLEGGNVLAIEVHQSSAGSSDLGIDVEVSGKRPNGGGPGGAVLTRTGPVMARAFNGGEWSALTEASFIVGTPASSANLVVSEIYYNPPGSLEDTEFIELMNTSQTDTIDLTNVTLTGVTYAFPEGFTLAPLERVVVVKDQGAFATAYNTAGMNIAPGDFGSTNLANGGEEIAVIAEDGVTDIQRFTYNDKAPWPESADGPGFSLVLIAPQTNPDHTVPGNWRASAATGGNPGASDAMDFSGDPSADGDGDSVVAFLEHALGTSDTVASADALPAAAVGLLDPGTGTLDNFLTLTFQRNLAADDVIYEVEVGSDLSAWATATTFVSSTNNGDGTATEVHRSNQPISAALREFIRLKVSAR